MWYRQVASINNTPVGLFYSRLDSCFIWKSIVFWCLLYLYHKCKCVNVGASAHTSEPNINPVPARLAVKRDRNYHVTQSQQGSLMSSMSLVFKTFLLLHFFPIRINCFNWLLNKMNQKTQTPYLVTSSNPKPDTCACRIQQTC